MTDLRAQPSNSTNDEATCHSLWNFQRGAVCREARLLSFLASLGATYPPLSFDTGNE